MEPEAFEQVAVLNKDRVHAYATLMLRNRAEAEDVAQEALVRLWRHRRKVERLGARTWLMRTVHNLCIDRLRARRVRAEVADAEAALEVQRDGNPGPEELAGSDELGRRIAEALGALGESDRSVVVMREVQQMPYEEIAEALGVPLGTLKARLHRARQRLRGRLSRAGVSP